jgi:hypothetical protein
MDRAMDLAVNEPLTDNALDVIEDLSQDDPLYHAAVRRLIAEIRLLRKELTAVKENMRWMACSIHQAYHDGPNEDCRKNTCESARAYSRRA